MRAFGLAFVLGTLLLQREAELPHLPFAAAAGLPTRLDAVGAFSAEALLTRMAGDKKAEGGGLTLILARAIGETFVDKAVDRAAVSAFLKTEGAS